MNATRVLRCGRFALDVATPRVMGIVNVTPDSFSDGGAHATSAAAIRHAERLIAEGADLVDVGAESTRPGATPVGADEEWRRLDPVLAALRDAAVPVSVDTRRPDTMRRALDAGASMINDVAGFASDDARSRRRGVRLRGLRHAHAGRAGDDAGRAALRRRRRRGRGLPAGRADALVAAGVARDRIVVDPGFGFGKTREHDLALLRALDAFAGARLAAAGRVVAQGPDRRADRAGRSASGSPAASPRRSSRRSAARRSSASTTSRRPSTRCASGARRGRTAPRPAGRRRDDDSVTTTGDSTA